MSAHTELLSAVLADPDAEEPRDRLAELLIAAGDPRGELIAIQMKLARNQGNAPQLRKRARPLLERHRHAWSGGIADLVDKFTFHRGFAEHIEVDSALFLRIADKLYSMAPIRHLTLAGAHAVAKDLFDSPHLSRIVSMSLERCELDDDDAALLAASPHVNRLRWLSLAWNHIGKPGLEAIAAAGQLAQLQFLRFNDNAAPDPTIRAAGVDETGAVLDIEVPDLGRELRETHGDLPWLTYAPDNQLDWPPDRDL